MLIILCLTCTAVILITVFVFNRKQLKLTDIEKLLSVTSQQTLLNLHEKISGESKAQLKELHELQQQFKVTMSEHREKNMANQLHTQKLTQEGLQKSMQDVRQQLTQFLESNANSINRRMEALTTSTSDRLKEISGQVEKRLAEGFEKTTATFTDIVKRLAIIDEAQKKITELSSNVVSLQSILDDKRSRGAFGEIQLAGLIRNVMPENSFDLQFTLSNDKRCDCILYLPEPTGNIVIDAKFPLETYKKLNELDVQSTERKTLTQQFKQDLKIHVLDIASKYILPGETADGAMMFIPAEAIFADIHAYHPDIVEFANAKRVWLVSPTTMMAILTTARAVLKDVDTRKQVHIIQEHLTHLGKDFSRFQKRMDNLAKHIDQAQEDVAQVHTSAKKISSRFTKIEQLDIAEASSENADILE